MASTEADKRKSRATSSFPMPADTWDQKLREHHSRMHIVKGSIPKDTPFQLSFRSPRQSPRGPRALPVLNPQTPSRGSSRAGASMKTSSPATVALGAAPRTPLTVDDLPEEERALCEKFINMLQRKSTEDSKDLLEAMYVQSETRRLLKGYGGVFPTMLNGKRSSGNSPDDDD